MSELTIPFRKSIFYIFDVLKSTAKCHHGVAGVRVAILVTLDLKPELVKSLQIQRMEEKSVQKRRQIPKNVIQVHVQVLDSFRNFITNLIALLLFQYTRYDFFSIESLQWMVNGLNGQNLHHVVKHVLEELRNEHEHARNLRMAANLV